MAPIRNRATLLREYQAAGRFITQTNDGLCVIEPTGVGKTHALEAAVRFITQTNDDLCVIEPTGVGKTYALTRRGLCRI